MKSKSMQRLRSFCDHIHPKKIAEGKKDAWCTHVGDADDRYFHKDLNTWRRDACLPLQKPDADLDRMVRDVATCALADVFVHSPARTSSYAVLVNDLRRANGTAACDGTFDWAPGPTRHRYPDAYPGVSDLAPSA